MGVIVECNTDEEWLALKRQHLTSTKMAAVANLSDYETPLHVFRDYFDPGPRRDNKYMRWGRLLEPVIAAEYEQVTGKHLVAAPRFMRHGTEPWAGSSFDRFYGDDHIVEIKTGTSSSGKWGREGTDDVPLEYLIQCQWQMSIANRHSCEIAVLLLDTRDFQVHPIRYDDAIIKMLLDIGADFWKNHIEARIAPPPNFKHPKTAELMQEIYGVKDDLIVDLEIGADHLLDEYFKLSDATDDAEKAKKEKAAEILALIGEAAIGTVPSGRNIRRKKVTRAAYMVPESSWTGDNLGQLLKSYRRKKGPSEAYEQ